MLAQRRLYSAVTLSHRAVCSSSGLPRAHVRSHAARRDQSTTPNPRDTSFLAFGTHLVAGLAGGATVILVGYAWYHFSGFKEVMDTGKAVRDSFQKTKRAIQERAPKYPNEALEFLRGVAKTYMAMIPGASKYVDSLFDAFDDLHEMHSEEVQRILNAAYDEVRQVLSEGEGVSLETSARVMGVLSHRLSELEAVGRRAGEDALRSLRERHPEVVDALGSGYGQLRELVQHGGPELVNRVREMAEAAAMGNKKQVEELKEFVREKAKEAGEGRGEAASRGWKSLKQWLKTTPSAEEALKKMPDVDALIKASQEHGHNAKNLLCKTYQDVANVLQEKAEEAKKLKSEEDEDAKKQP
ncbi:hypothetical protein OBBRIDRAFT_791245 [Obba rivulosa]|uniref:Uncharacterized protein n=1 Tax=Obba rivulosa TaxID=1052685 RepID=A0A8E2AWS5_9APHY|nr:hypothetical protein OBBRIDRAFT_791245 [Obba rivulosa]